MDKTKGDYKPYPPGYASIEAHVRQAQEKISQLEVHIKTIPHDKPEQVLTPPGFPKLRHFSNRNNRIALIKQLQEDIRKDTLGEVEKALASAGLQGAQTVRDRVVKDLYASPYENMAPDQRQQRTDPQWDINKSQDLMVQFFNRTERQEPVKEQSVEIGQSTQSISTRFIQSLHFTKGYDKADVEPDIEPEKD